MTGLPQEAFVLGQDQVDFVAGPVSIAVGSADENLVPSLVRGYGCRVSTDRRRIGVFLSTIRSEAVLRNLRAGGALAVVFNRPSTHQTLQLKATGATIAPLAAGDRDGMLDYGARFGAEIAGLGYPQRFVQALVAAVREEAVVVTFAPVAGFQQTPGPTAGSRLGPRP